MPQGRKKVPFSGKAKKEQLKVKKQSKEKFLLKKDENVDEASVSVEKINFQSSKDGGAKPNRYALQFFKESPEDIKKQKEMASHVLELKSEKSLEVDGSKFFDKDLDFPKRPPWDYGLEKTQLEAQEQRYFTEYIKGIQQKFDWKELSLFELNIETWRQLWRVIEMSDIILFIVDIRFAALMFPPSLYDYVTNDLKKDFILVINKIDLAPAGLVVAWKHYFEENFPNLHIIMFTNVPAYNLVGKKSGAGLQIRRRRGAMRMAAEGAQQILDVCKKIVGDKVDLSSWHNKIKNEMDTEYTEDEAVNVGEVIHLKNVDTEYYEYEKFNKGILTIGCVGQPNVGKSSLLNALMGKKVVSVSKTPGHTKHFQTIFLTPNVKLCDCPGLVFPSKVPKSLQVLMGSFPIAQLRMPYTTIKYIAERIDLVSLLKINHPTNDDTWSALDVCDGWAKKKGYYTAKAARLDSYRAANSLLRMALDGKICFSLRPLGYTDQKEYWSSHPDVKIVEWIQAKDSGVESNIEVNVYDSDVSDEYASDGIQQNKETSSNEDTDTHSDTEEVGTSKNKFAALSSDE